MTMSQPTGDEPLDDLERAWVRAMVVALLAEIREELADEAEQCDGSETNHHA